MARVGSCGLFFASMVHENCVDTPSFWPEATRPPHTVLRTRSYQVEGGLSVLVGKEALSVTRADPEQSQLCPPLSDGGPARLTLRGLVGSVLLLGVLGLIPPTHCPAVSHGKARDLCSLCQGPLARSLLSFVFKFPTPAFPSFALIAEYSIRAIRQNFLDYSTA